MVCFAPWAFGAVEAWAQLVLALGIAAVALLRVPQIWGRSERPARACLPSLALFGLLILALVQAAPWPSAFLGWLAPGTARLRQELLPRAPERVAGDPRAAVPLPRPSVSANPDATLQAAAGLASAWIVLQSVLTLGGGFAPYRRFAFVLVANATLLSLFSIVQRLTWNGKIYWLRDAPGGSAGPFVDHNHLAAYLNLGLGLALGFLFAPPREGAGASPARRGAPLWAGYAAGLILVGVLVSLSRSGFAGMVLALFSAALVLRAARFQVAAGLGAVILLCVLFLAALGGTQPYQKRLETLLGRDPYADRLRIWTGALRAWPQSPLIGNGLGTFATATARFYRFDAGESYMHAENEYVEWLVEGGLVGLGLVLAAAAGTVALGRRALLAAPSPGRRALVVGGLFGIVALAVHSGGDFALRIPGVALAAVMLVAHLARLGLRAIATGHAQDPRPAVPGFARVPLITCGVALVGLALVVPAFRQARAEAYRGYASMPLDGALSQSLFAEPGDMAWDPARLDDARERLLQALRERPDWAEGHLALGLVYLRLYEQSARHALEREVQDPVLRARFARPLWLSMRVRAAAASAPLTAETLLTLDPVRAFLAPAARCFLEARRCDCLRPLPYTKLATLSFLLDPGDPGRQYLERAFRLAGGSDLEIARVGEVAVLWGELDLAARCWRSELVLGTRPWTSVALVAREFLSPDAMLREVVPDGAHAVRFAQYLFAGPNDVEWRRAYAAEALRRLGRDHGLDTPDRFALGAEAYQLLGESDKARKQMLAALALRPERAHWRKTLVEWLVAWGRPEEAYGQARLGVSLNPRDADASGALELAADALARMDADSRAPESGGRP